MNETCVDIVWLIKNQYNSLLQIMAHYNNYFTKQDSAQSHTGILWLI